MNDKHFEILSDVELEQAAGGVSISLTLDKDGASLAGPLGELKVPNPLTLIGKTIGGLFGATGELLKGAGGALTSVGQLFDFS
jgi:hypothetical protein